MRNICVGLLCFGILLAIISQFTFAELTEHKQTGVIKPVLPSGSLDVELGKYLTIEGVKSDGIKEETGTFLVDTVNGKKLEKPVSVVIRGEVIANHNLTPARLNLPEKQRCVFKGYESGEMIGVPPAITSAAKEQGWKNIPMSPVHWQWRPYFVALVVVEPKQLKLEN